MFYNGENKLFYLESSAYRQVCVLGPDGVVGVVGLVGVPMHVRLLGWVGVGVAVGRGGVLVAVQRRCVDESL